MEGGGILVLKLAGGFCIMGAAVWLLGQMRMEQKRRLMVLQELVSVLEFMGDEIRMNRTPMPVLLRRAIEGRCDEVANFLAAVRSGSRGLTEDWRKGAERLSIPETEKRMLADLGQSLTGDEEQACRGLALVCAHLRKELQRQLDAAVEALKRKTALCLSGAAFVIILLI